MQWITWVETGSPKRKETSRVTYTVIGQIFANERRKAEEQFVINGDDSDAPAGAPIWIVHCSLDGCSTFHTKSSLIELIERTSCPETGTNLGFEIEALCFR